MPLWAQGAPHAAHGPRFGGVFATAASDMLHVEAVWSEQRRLRLFVMDASGEPLPVERLRDIAATAIAANRESVLTLLEAENYFEARIPTLASPATVSVRFKPAPAAPEDRLVFTFTDYSESVIGVGRSAPVEIPETLPGIISALSGNRRDVKALVERNDFAALFGAEDRIRDLVLAIEPHLATLAPGSRSAAATALTAAVRACWLLHTVLDYGEVPQRDAALKQLDEALDRLTASIAGSPE